MQQQSTIQCPVCNKSFKFVYKLTEHIKKSHLNYSNNLNNLNYNNNLNYSNYSKNRKNSSNNPKFGVLSGENHII